MINDYPISKDWDCKYTLEELIKKGSGYVYLVANYHKHKYDDCYGGFILLFHTEDYKFIQVGIKEDGFVYIGDQCYFDMKNTKSFKIDEAIDFMIKYRDFLNSKFEFERKLIKIFDESCVNIIYDYNYSPEYKYGKELTYLENKYEVCYNV